VDRDQFPPATTAGSRNDTAVVENPDRDTLAVVTPSLRQPLCVDSITHPIFVCAWLANFALVSASASVFIFADWVAWVATSTAAGGSLAISSQEELPGRIIQFGLAGAILSRLFLGQAIDRFGVRTVWMLMSLLMLAGAGVFAAVTAVSPFMTVGRVLYAVGLSGMFTCSAFHMQSCVAEHRRTEFLGLLGSSGFVGMIAGTQMVDLLKWMTGGDPGYFRYVFVAAMIFVAGHGVLAWLVTSGFPRPDREIRPSLIRLMRDYWPGPVVIIAMIMGLVLTVPSVYLVRFNRYAGLGGIAGFWTAYAISAFLLRIRTARLSQKVGRYRLIAIGLLAQGLGLWAIIPVTQWWHLIGAAIVCGLGHALLFPSIVSLGSGRFPARYRGSGINLTMGFLDLGTAVSAPVLGQIIDLDVFDGVGYRQMFLIVGASAILMAVVWMLLHRNHIDSEVTAE